MKPADVLAATQVERSRDRTVVGVWLSSLGDEERSRFHEFVVAFRAHPEYSMPLLSEALQSDEILGEAGAKFPDLTGESLKKFLKRYDEDSQDSD
jgi:hypothetical protein